MSFNSGFGKKSKICDSLGNWWNRNSGFEIFDSGAGKFDDFASKCSWIYSRKTLIYFVCKYSILPYFTAYSSFYHCKKSTKKTCFFDAKRGCTENLWKSKKYVSVIAWSFGFLTTFDWAWNYEGKIFPSTKCGFCGFKNWSFW